MVQCYRLFAHPDELPAYRAMTLTVDGRVMDNVTLSADSDLEALTTAETMVNGFAVELWDGLRFIERFESRQRSLGQAAGDDLQIRAGPTQQSLNAVRVCGYLK